MAFKRQIFDGVMKYGIKLFSLDSANKVSCELSERLAPVFKIAHNGDTFLIHCPNKMTMWRAETYFHKEPETIEWIDSFGPDDILFDIGANVGLYTIYAAKKGVRVVAFEPESQNYAILNKNIHSNQLTDKVTSLNLAMSDADSLDYLYIANFQTGGALNNFGDATDWKGSAFQETFRQGVLSYSLDSFLQQYPHFFPNHIKVDVDGIEGKIISGARQTLSDSRLKSIQIEINDGVTSDTKLTEIIEDCGLKFKWKRHAEMFDSGEFASVYNYVFSREI